MHVKYSPKNPLPEFVADRPGGRERRRPTKVATNIGDFEPGDVKRVPDGQYKSAYQLIANGDFERTNAKGEPLTEEELANELQFERLNLIGR